MGLCCSTEPTLAAVVMASGMVQDWNHAQGAGANHVYLYKHQIVQQC